MNDVINRRRFILVSAAAAGLGLVPFGAPKKAAAGELVEWRGACLGAAATVRIHHSDRSAARHLIGQVVAESRRLELVFSLYRQDSSLCELNRGGTLIAPPADLSDLLSLCDHFWRLTDGTFDPTVQPLWRCYADHFAINDKTSAGPSPAERKKALNLVGWEKVQFDRDKIVFDRRGMGITLNGIAQGYITDRVVELLRAAGIESCLVDMGEIRGLGSHPDGRPWEVAVEAPSGDFDATRPISIVNKAVATSGAFGFRFDEQGRCNHLFDPSTGTCAYPARNLTVVASTAVCADALSTAFALMDEERIKAVLSQSGNTQLYVTTQSGRRAVTTASGSG
jgi:thiamine biosynthesis lipoprotein